MSRQYADILDYYDYAVVLLMSEKCGMSHMDALRQFTQSETHRLLADTSMELSSFGAPALFDMWESEQVTSNPRNYIISKG